MPSDLRDRWRDEDLPGLDELAERDRALALEALGAHYGYEPTEIPRYGVCPHGCGETLRIDRLDLVDEHRARCDAATPW